MWCLVIRCPSSAIIIAVELALWKIAISNPKFCHKNMKIVPTKKREKFAIFCCKNCQILHIEFTNRRTFFRRGPEYYIDLKMHTKSHSIAICISERKKKIKKKTSIMYQNESTKICKETHQNVITQDIHKK